MRFRPIHSVRFAAVAAWFAIPMACLAGCAGVDTSESQLFGNRGNFKSATITYRVEHDTPEQEAPRSALAKLFNPRVATHKPERRVTTLAVQYPHPAGRAGYARIECVTTHAPATTDAPRGWLQRIRQLADDTLPGIKMADGVEEAVGLDVPVGELDEVLSKLQQSTGVAQVAGESVKGGASTQVACTINDVAIPTRQARVAELDKLVARARHDGGIISYTSRSIEPIAEPVAETFASDSRPSPNATPAVLVKSAQEDKPINEAAQDDAGVQAASYSQPTTLRWPQADPPAP